MDGLTRDCGDILPGGAPHFDAPQQAQAQPALVVRRRLQAIGAPAPVVRNARLLDTTTS